MDGEALRLIEQLVAPAFEFADFALPSRAVLCARHPRERALIDRLTRA